jgi:arylsulfatase A-like enzyme
MKLLLLLCTPLLALQGLAAAEPGKPNVLFISLDDLNDWVGCLGGNPQTKTPNIDRLAKSGVLFTNAHCAAPSCNPSRSSLFTGVPPYRSGLYSNAPTQKLRGSMPDAVLLPRHFSNNGYWSAGAGKLLHYIIDQQSWDDYFPEKVKENPFPLPSIHRIDLSACRWACRTNMWKQIGPRLMSVTRSTVATGS